jgi:hypothetical protein
VIAYFERRRGNQGKIFGPKRDKISEKIMVICAKELW